MPIRFQSELELGCLIFLSALWKRPALTHLPRVCHSCFCHTDVIWRHDVILWCYLMSSHHRPGYKMQVSNIRKCLLNLTFYLWPWPSNSSERSSMPIPVPIFRSVCQFVCPWERWQTHRQTGPILLPRPLMWEVNISAIIILIEPTTNCNI